MNTRVPVVAILNSNDDVVELLRVVIEQAGFVAVSTHIDAVRRGESGLLPFLTEHQPDVVVYDLVPPYDRSWMFLTHLRETLLQGCEVVITSTNPVRAGELARTSEHIYEVVGKPYDLDCIVSAVKEAAHRAQSRA